MRKYFLLALTGLIAIAATTAVAAPGDQQTITAKVTPTKLDKKKYRAAKLFVDVETANNDENTALAQPPKATRTVVDFPTNLKFDTSAVPGCKVDSSAIVNTTQDQATELCGPDSKVSIDSGTSGTVTIGFPGLPSGVIPIQITAFNGQKPNTVYLHTDPANIPTKPVLVGKLKKGPRGFGSSLDVKIPALGAGGISSFKTLVKAGKYVQARCKSKTNKFRARTTYSDHSPTVAQFSTKCSQKRSRR